MKIQIHRTMWGVETPWADVLPRLATDGYDGIEAPLPWLQNHAALLAEAAPPCIPMIFTEGVSVSAHVASFRAQLEAAQAFDPVCVTCHDGVDAWSDDEARRYLREVLAIEADLGVPVAHETHRGRVFYTPWRTAALLDAFDDLRLCCDFSHWVCVAERLLDDQAEALAHAASRALHVHARVGYEEGPQVPDPRAEAYAAHGAAHEGWWRQIWAAQEAAGQAVSTMTPEYGPPLYQVLHPSTGEPLADLADVCAWQAARLRTLYAAWRADDARS